MHRVGFNLPENMSATTAAEAFNCYLIGPLAYVNQRDEKGIRPHGPWFDPQTHRWILDSSRSIWMHLDRTSRSGELISDDTVKHGILQAMVSFMEHRYARVQKY